MDGREWAYPKALRSVISTVSHSLEQVCNVDGARCLCFEVSKEICGGRSGVEGGARKLVAGVAA